MNDGNWMPATALGTSMQVDLNDRQYMRQAVIWAIEAGYRHIDTAALYVSEDLIGEAIKNVTRRGIVKRTELFITTKLTFTVATCKDVMQSMRDSLKRLQLQYLDMILIHTPRNVLRIRNRDYLVIWKCLEEAKRMGLTRSIGVSNFNATEINRILLHSKTPPAVNQIETNPTFTNLELVAYCQSKGIVVTGYAPLGFLVPRSFTDLQLPPTFDDPILVGMAEKYCVEVSQIVLRYLVESFKKSETVQLNDGNMMPATAFGTFMTDLDNRPYMPQAVEWAIKAGYRHIDTAALYASEDKIGEALKDLIKRAP
ncbi:aldo-keto reductase AKR2E4-like [Maniola hyperantus]|uniref:aldo-keto reductase AKR2E4-like n=1 Tax=Aphantopus hyperantus TaxID=2795564 RepID=UPI00374855DF